MSLFETKNRFSAVCSQVLVTGEPLLVTRRGVPIVRIVPVSDGSDETSVWDSVEEGRERYGPLTDEFELPNRPLPQNRGDPLD